MGGEAPACCHAGSRRGPVSSSWTGSAPACLGPSSWCSASLASLVGDYEVAAGHFERALQANAAAGRPLAVANARRVPTPPSTPAKAR